MTHVDDRPERAIPPTASRADPEPDPERTLRQRAESLARHSPASSPEAIAALSREDVQRTVHELQVHQIELELQREELRRTQAQLEALRDSMERSQMIIDDILDWQSWFGLDGRYLWVNPAVEQMTGYTPAEVMAMPDWVSVLIAEEDWPVFGETFRQAIHGSRGTGFEIRYVRKDGVKRWISVDWKPVVDAQGKPLGTRASARDITDLKLTEEALRRSQSMLTRTEAIAHVGSWEWDMATDTVIWSDELYRILQRDPAEGAPSFADHSQLYSPEDMQRLTEAVDAARDQGMPYELELNAIRKDGATRTLLARGYAEMDAQQDVTRLFGCAQDITERRAAEQALQASEARARAIIDASPVPFALNDDRDHVLYLNPAFIESFGYTLEDIPTLTDWWPRAYPDPDCRAWVENTWRELLERVRQESGRFAPMETTVRCKDGQLRTVLVSASALTPSFDGLHLVDLYDITDLKHAQERAEQAARIKAEFLANMSHEIRTPLNAMLGLAQLLENEALSADQRHLLERLRAAGRSLLALINDILDVSKLESGELRLETRTFAPAAVLAQVASLLGQQARAKGLAFQLDMPPGLVDWLCGDPLRLEQILVNLVGNAIKFTEHGEVRINVSQQGLDTTAVRLRLEVRDTGIGIAPEHLAMLGETFTQADGSITRRFGGTGLGLAISKQLVARMDGTFGIDSTLGVGSTFWCELPFERVSEGVIPPDEAMPAERPPGPRLSGVHCLVVDDCPLNREVVERVLTHEGARATLATDGRQALDRLRARPNDIAVVLMDIQMPVMDGLTATRAIRQELGLSALPVIVFSAGVLAEQRQEAREAGISDFLAKPVDLEDLIAMLQRWCATTEPDASRPIRVPERTPAEATRTDFPDIPGLDTRQAARLLGNDWALFLKLLPRLTTDFSDAAQRTRDDLARGAVAAATQRLHALQGRAGYLGALELVQTARVLEQCILEGNTDLEVSMDVELSMSAFEEQLAALLVALEPWLEQPTPTPAAEDPAKALDLAQLAALHDALNRCDLESLALFDALEPSLSRRDGHAATAALAEAIRSLRFEEALALMATEPHPDQAA